MSDNLTTCKVGQGKKWNENAWNGREGKGIERHIMKIKCKAWYGMTRKGNARNDMA
jgi:hypothetical protein